MGDYLEGDVKLYNNIMPLNNQKNSKLYKVALYIRLSREDGDKEESSSVTNQRAILTRFVQKNEDFVIVDEYVDDGFTGTNFNRPGFQRLLKDLKFKKVDTVITKIYLDLEGIILMQVSMFKNSFQKTILDILQY